MKTQLILDCKSYLDAIKSFEISPSPLHNPSNREAYVHSIHSLIEKIKELFEEFQIEARYVSLELLTHAHRIQGAPACLSTQEGNAFTHRLETLEAGETLCHSFDRLCQTLWSASLEINDQTFSEEAFRLRLTTFPYPWGSFVQLLRKDQADAETVLLQPSNKPFQTVQNCSPRE